VPRFPRIVAIALSTTGLSTTARRHGGALHSWTVVLVTRALVAGTLHSGAFDGALRSGSPHDSDSSQWCSSQVPGARALHSVLSQGSSPGCSSQWHLAAVTLHGCALHSDRPWCFHRGSTQWLSGRLGSLAALQVGPRHRGALHSGSLDSGALHGCTFDCCQIISSPGCSRYGPSEAQGY